MATKQGRLGVAALAANTETVVYTISEDAVYATVSVTFTNTTSETAIISLAYSLTDVPSAEEYVFKDVELVANSTFDVTCQCLATMERVVAKSSVAGVNVRVSGLEAANSPYYIAS